MVNSQKNDYDLVIIGGGLVGSGLACALGGTNLSVLVVETGPAQVEVSNEYDLRVSAITTASRNFFQSVGVWESLQKIRMGEVREMRIWEEIGNASLHLDSAETNETCLAYIIENSVIRRVFYDRLQKFSNIRYMENSTVQLHEICDHFVKLKVNGEPIRTGLIVGADGAKSVVRDWAQISSSGWSFNQTAIVATVTTTESHHYTAFQKFLQTGPLAFLPLDDLHTSSIVWSADTVEADRLFSMPEEDFLQELESAFDSRLGKVINISTRASFPLSLMHVGNTVQHRVALVGDAAHRVHPLAGQGLNLGLADVAVLAETLIHASGDIGSVELLRKYERSRAGDTRLMVKLMDVFKRLYGSANPTVTGLRNFGMDLIDSNNMIKKIIMSFAAGEKGDTPELLRTKEG